MTDMHMRVEALAVRIMERTFGFACLLSLAGPQRFAARRARITLKMNGGARIVHLPERLV